MNLFKSGGFLAPSSTSDVYGRKLPHIGNVLGDFSGNFWHYNSTSEEGTMRRELVFQ